MTAPYALLSLFAILSLGALLAWCARIIGVDFVEEQSVLDEGEEQGGPGNARDAARDDASGMRW